MYLQELSPIDAIFIHSRVLEPFSQFLINSDLLIKTITFLKITGIEHAHLTTTERISDILLIGIYNSFWSSTRYYSSNIFRFWFKSIIGLNTLSSKFWVMKWLIKIINKIEKDKKISGYKLNMNLFSRKQFRNKLFIRISKALETDYLCSRSKTIHEDDIITLFRRHPHRKKS